MLNDTLFLPFSRLEFKLPRRKVFRGTGSCVSGPSPHIHTTNGYKRNTGSLTSCVGTGKQRLIAKILDFNSWEVTVNELSFKNLVTL